jgi:hypothetical protein
MIIISVVGFAGFIFLGFRRYNFCNLKVEKEDDPKLRIYGKTSFLVWFLVILAFSCLGTLAYFASYFGRTENYDGVFELKGDWTAESSGSFNEDDTNNIYVYRQNSEITNSETVKIQVRHLSAIQFAKTKTEFNEQIKNTLSNLKRRPAELKVESKAQKKAIKQEAKEKEKELKKSLKGKKAELNAALTENKEQRKAALDALPRLLKEALAQVKAEKKIARKKWLANQDAGTYTALSGNREYTVTLESSDMLKAINLSPYGFGSGYFDGTVYLGQKTGSLLSLDLHPSFKMSKAGKTYIIGFVLGIMVNCVMGIWLLIIVIHRIVILSWRKKWSLLPVKDKIIYIEGLTDAVLNKIDGEIEKAEYDFEEHKREYRSSPETALKKHNEAYREIKDTKGKVLDTLGNIFTAGGSSRKKTEEEHEHLADITNYYYSRYIIIQMQVKRESAQYHWLRKKAELYIMQIKYFVENVDIKIKDEFDQAEKLSLDKTIGGVIDKDTECLLKEIGKIDEDFNQKMEIEFFKTLNSSTQLMKLVGFTNSTAIGVAGLGIALAFAYAGAYNKNSEIKNELKRNMIDLREQITKIESNRTLAEGYVGRAMNINKILIEAFSRYTKLYDELEKIVFPEGDYSKSKASRKAAEDRGELYFSPEETQKVRALGRFSKSLKQIIETDF